MDLKRHFAASLSVATFSLLFSQSVPFLSIQLFSHEITVCVLCIGVGVLVDIDHMIDFRVNGGHMTESLESRYKKGRMLVIFHGIENTIILISLSVSFPFLAFLTISYICHILMDVYGNGVSFQAYFYTVRFGRRLWRSPVLIRDS